eukprot:3855501-Prymnesium_polylepis.1
MVTLCAHTWMKAAHVAPRDLSELYSLEREEHAADRSSVMSIEKHDEAESHRLEGRYLTEVTPPGPAMPPPPELWGKKWNKSSVQAPARTEPVTPKSVLEAYPISEIS